MKLDDIPFVIYDTQKEMPKHSETHVRIPRNYEMGLPQDFMKESEKLDNKYLNNHLHAIEEIAEKFPNHLLPTWMKDYQNKYFKANLAHDGFFKHATNIDSRIKYRQSTRPFIEFGKLIGATLTAGSTANNAGGWSTELEATLVSSSGVIGSFYNQIALDIQTQAGNYNLGCYDNSSNPHNLLQSTGSISVPAASFAVQSLTEFSLTTAGVWVAFITSSDLAKYYYASSGGSRAYKGNAYGSGFLNPFGTPEGTDSVAFHTQLSHS